MALLFNLKGGLYEDASVVFLCFFFKLIKKVFVFKGNACILLEAVLCVFFFLFSCYGFRLDQFPGLNHCINTRVDARAGRSAAVSTSGWRQGVRM